MARQVDPLVAFARKYHDRLFADNATVDRIEKSRTKIQRREDVNPKGGIRKYGHVVFADPVNKKYPIDTPEHIKAAISYISMPKNAAKYGAGEVALIKQRIRSAAKTIGMTTTAKSHDASVVNEVTEKSARETADSLLHTAKDVASTVKEHAATAVDSLHQGLPLYSDRDSVVSPRKNDALYVDKKRFRVTRVSPTHIHFRSEQPGQENGKPYKISRSHFAAGVAKNRIAVGYHEYESPSLADKVGELKENVSNHLHRSEGEGSENITNGEYDDDSVILSLAKGRFMQTGPCVGDEYATVPKPGFSARDSGVVAEVLPNGMVGVDYMPYAEPQRRMYLHRSELITQMRQEYIDLVKSASQQESEEVSVNQKCRKCKQNPISVSLPLSGYCDDCLTVSEHWW
jgi:hypothetical protein